MSDNILDVCLYHELPMSELQPGKMFEWNDDVAIKTLKKRDSDFEFAVSLSTGRELAICHDTMVIPVKKLTITST